ncbi:MAG: protease HtpX [Steroidobacteraceae bacterium]
MKRIVWFVAVNIAVLVTVTVIVGVFRLDRYLSAYGLNLGGLLVLSGVFGFGGAFISLALSKWLAIRSMGVRLIDVPESAIESRVLTAVADHARRLRLGMPAVGIFESPQLNAFATGARRNHALVAVSSALAEVMDPQQLEAVLGHEMTHVANGDMITLGLLQGVLNTFVIFLARVIGSAIDGLVGGRREEGGQGGVFYFLIVIALEILFGVLATMIVMAYSRRREYRADAGGAALAGTHSMVGALRILQRDAGAQLPGQLRAFGIHGEAPGGVLRRLFMSHPPIEERIAALERAHLGG